MVAAWVQGPKTLIHPMLLSQALSRDVDFQEMEHLGLEPAPICNADTTSTRVACSAPATAQILLLIF